MVLVNIIIYLHEAIIRLINDSNSGFNDLSSSSSIPKSNTWKTIYPRLAITYID